MNIWVSSLICNVVLTLFLLLVYNFQFPQVTKTVPCLISEKFTAIEYDTTVYKFMCKNPDRTLSEKTVTTSTYFKFTLNQVAEFKVSKRVNTNPIYELLIQLGILSSVILFIIFIFKS